ncbi:23857_t:CDS:2 [Entrophospora sp. SA101]|nr:23857_t:CDS:2 [Entrophospora sp. SA101]CAJ0838861.1 12797_t:CDS:2 [Entrophospora sp. SA101]
MSMVIGNLPNNNYTNGNIHHYHYHYNHHHNQQYNHKYNHKSTTSTSSNNRNFDNKNYKEYHFRQKSSANLLNSENQNKKNNIINNKSRYNNHRNNNQRLNNNNNKMASTTFSNNNNSNNCLHPTMRNNNNITNKKVAAEHKYKTVDEICSETNLYLILGVERSCSSEELRRAYINRSRICHPDKFPEYPKATEAFQKLSYAYETLNKSSSRRAYDISGTSDLGSVSGTGDDTLHGVLYQLFLEFMDGDFEMIRSLVNALNEGNPGLNLGEDAIETLETAFGRMREILLAGKKYVKIVQFELIRLYELQQQLRSLSYFDIFGRIRLTMQLARITLSIPMLIDSAMKSEFKQLGSKGINKGLLGDGLAKVISGLVNVLEKGEQYL